MGPSPWAAPTTYSRHRICLCPPSCGHGTGSPAWWGPSHASPLPASPCPNSPWCLRPHGITGLLPLHTPQALPLQLHDLPVVLGTPGSLASVVLPSRLPWLSCPAASRRGVPSTHHPLQVELGDLALWSWGTFSFLSVGPRADLVPST